MPVILDTFPSLPSQSRYDWDTLMSGDIWQLSRGDDFNGQSKTFVQAARMQAKRRGGTLKTRMLSDGTVVVQFRKDV